MSARLSFRAQQCKYSNVKSALQGKLKLRASRSVALLPNRGDNTTVLLIEKLIEFTSSYKIDSVIQLNAAAQRSKLQRKTFEDEAIH